MLNDHFSHFLSSFEMHDVVIPVLPWQLQSMRCRCTGSGKGTFSCHGPKNLNCSIRMDGTQAIYCIDSVFRLLIMGYTNSLTAIKCLFYRNVIGGEPNWFFMGRRERPRQLFLHAKYDSQFTYPCFNSVTLTWLKSAQKKNTNTKDCGLGIQQKKLTKTNTLDI